METVFFSILSVLDEWDKGLLLMLNYDGSAFADTFWWGISAKWIWIPAALSLLYTLVRPYHKWRETLWALFLLVGVIALSDIISASVVKPFFERLRPSHNPDISGLLHYVYDYRGGTHGFVSSHAANAFGTAVFLSLLFKRRWATVTLLIWAAGIGYSRVYLGVHYPGDILGGALLGAGIAWAGYRVYRFGLTVIHEKSLRDSTPSAVPRKWEPAYVLSTLYSTVMINFFIAIADDMRLL